MTEALNAGTRLILIEGPRRSGKTSLASITLREIPHVTLDMRALGFQQFITASDLLKGLQAAIEAFLREESGWREQVSNTLKGIRGVELSATGLGLSWKRKEGGELATDIPELFRALGKAARMKNTNLVLFIDEAQEFSRLTGLDFTSIMASVYDNLPKIQMVVSGSQSGMVVKFLRFNDPKAPLYGRSHLSIKMGGLNEQRAIEFLSHGFRQAGIEIPERTLRTIASYSQWVIGWLAFFGFTITSRVKASRLSEKALESLVHSVATEAADQAVRELLERFASLRQPATRRYLMILKCLGDGPLPWSKLRFALTHLEGRVIYDRNFSTLLENLVAGGFVERTETGYGIADPLLRVAAKEGLLDARIGVGRA